MSEHGRGQVLPSRRSEDRTRRARRAALGLVLVAAGGLASVETAIAAVEPVPGLPAQTTPGLPLPPLPGPLENPPPVGETPSTDGGAGVNAGAGGTDAGAQTGGGAGQQGGGSSGGNQPTINIVNYGGVFNSYQSSATPAATPATPAAYIAPFPVVHIRGRISGSRVKVERLAVSAPSGATARVTCRGGKRKGCPRTASKSRATRGSTFVRFTHAQRTLRAGAKIEVAVTKPGLIGKFTRFTIRSRKAPLRSDACLLPGARRSSPCP